MFFPGLYFFTACGFCHHFDWFCETIVLSNPFVTFCEKRKVLHKGGEVLFFHISMMCLVCLVTFECSGVCYFVEHCCMPLHMNHSTGTMLLTRHLCTPHLMSVFAETKTNFRCMCFSCIDVSVLQALKDSVALVRFACACVVSTIPEMFTLIHQGHRSQVFSPVYYWSRFKVAHTL